MLAPKRRAAANAQKEGVRSCFAAAQGFVPVAAAGVGTGQGKKNGC
jgi:hypothetical protein